MNDEKKNIRWECARPCEEDAELVFKWRNDPITRQMSFHTELKVWDTFYPNYKQRSFTIPELPPLFALWEGERVAFIFFESANHPNNPRRKCCTLSINLDPEKRDQGIGRAILNQLQAWVKQRGYDTLLGEIKAENISSLKAFENAGFITFAETVKYGQTILLLSVELTENPLFPQTVYIIAEAGSNWRLGSPKRDMAMAKTLIEAAADAGADGVKFQVYRPETIYVSNAGTSNYLEEAGIKEDISDIFTDLSMPYEMIPELAEYCLQCGIDFLSTPFSITDFEQVDPYVPLHKIASYELGHIRLLEKAAKSGKPLILSTGAATEDEIAWSIDYFYAKGGTQLILLQCTARYPAEPENMNLATIPWMQSRYKVQVGLSDHSRDPYNAPIAATGLGAVVIEKHFTLNNHLPGPDHFFAITVPELKTMVKAVRATYDMIGNRVKAVDPSEQELRDFCCRGVQAIKDIKPGEALHEGLNVAILRPGKQLKGMPPRMIMEYEGKKITKAVSLGHGIQPEDFNNE